MTYPFVTCINAYLEILSGFDRNRSREIEQGLIDALEEVGCSHSRYRRIKMDRDGNTPLQHLEAEAVYRYFAAYFEKAAKNCRDSRMRKTLEAWAPGSSLDIYSIQNIDSLRSNGAAA
jgi:hypothetical protein